VATVHDPPILVDELPGSPTPRSRSATSAPRPSRARVINGRPKPPPTLTPPSTPITKTRISNSTSKGRKIKGDTLLARVIKSRGFLSIEVSRVTGIHPRILSDYTSGYKTPHVRHVIALCKCLDVEPPDILQPSQPPSQGH
jgi:hypothetical protein